MVCFFNVFFLGKKEEKRKCLVGLWFSEGFAK